ncbi:MAG: hypothetical protein MI784_15490 [Cytophagales bacterium]|nr:hypothetical protein [Cytophagales bacterium]
MSSIPKSVIPFFKKAGWYEGRKEKLNISNCNLPDDFSDFYIDFMSELVGLEVHNKGKKHIELFGEKVTQEYDLWIRFDLMTDDISSIDGEETEFDYYSSLIGRQLFPVGKTNENWCLAIDIEKYLYLFNSGYNCFRIHNDPYEGIRCYLENDLYSTSYVLEEEGEHAGKWFKRE